MKTFMLANLSNAIYPQFMSDHERLPLTEETAGQVVIKTLDTLFTAASFGCYDGENDKFLKDIGLAVSYGVGATEDGGIDCLTVANWNGTNIFEVLRSEGDYDISWNIPAPVRYQISITDMLKRQLRSPITVNSREMYTQKLQFAVSQDGTIIPWLVHKDDGVSLLTVPDIEECIADTGINAATLFQDMEARILVDLFAEADYFDQFLTSLPLE